MNRILLFVLCLGFVAATAWWLASEEPTAELPAKDDTGLTRESTEDLMRTIGYVQ